MMSRNSEKILLNDRSQFKTIANETSNTLTHNNSNTKLLNDIDCSENDIHTYDRENNYFIQNIVLSEFWQKQKTDVIYENLCEGCGYGVFEAEGKLCDFCRFTITGRLKETNIYENICDKCGEIYSGIECELCLLKLNVIPKRKRSESKSNRILSGIFGTLKKVRSSRDKSNTSNTSKYRKLEIVHNVDGYENVFKTNKTFDLNQICELKRLNSTSSDHHIYGKLRKSDDHLMNSIENEKFNANSKSDPNLNKIIRRSTFLKNNSCSSIGEHKNYVNDHNNSIKHKTDKKLCITFQAHVIEWMTSLRRQTVDYHQHVDDSICNTKSIPSRNFSCCGTSNEYGLLNISYNTLSGEDHTLRSLLSNEFDLIQMVDNFKRNLMERQRVKRRAIYMKNDDHTDNDQQTTIDGIKQTLLRKSNRYGFCEKDSDFVTDLLSAFDTFLNREIHQQTPEVNSDNIISNNNDIENNTAIYATLPNESHQINDDGVLKLQCYNNEISKYILLNDYDIQLNSAQYKNLISNLLLSQTLNRIVLTYHQPLNSFLKIVSNHQEFGGYDFFMLYRIYSKLFITKSKSKNNVNKKNIPNELPPPALLPLTDQTEIIHHTSVSEEDIYQPIWKFQTVGNPRETYTTDGDDYCYDLTINDSSSKVVEDHGEWETDDEFMFSTKMKEPTSLDEMQPSKITKSEFRSETTLNTDSLRSLYGNSNDHYKNVCIFYSLTDIKLRAIIYNYDPQHLYFTSHHRHNSVITNSTFSIKQLEVPLKYKSVANLKSESHKNSTAKPAIPDSVQAWKFMLLDVNYIDDEEDMYVSEEEILKLKQIENEPVPTNTLQRFKSISTGNLLEIPQDKKKSIGERVRNKLQMGVLKLNNRSPKDKKGKHFFKRSDSTSLYLDDSVKPKYPIFGASLDVVEKDIFDCNVPRFVTDCITNIEKKDNIQSDGLYRASGNKVAIDDVKKKLAERYIYDPSLIRNEDVHTITGLLKSFFRELQTPLIPSNIYQKLPENLVDKTNLLTIKEVLQNIENPSKGTLKYLLKHLTKVALYSSENRMPASNLAIIWGPCILYGSSLGPFDIARMNTLTKILIENYDAIFADDERLVN